MTTYRGKMRRYLSLDLAAAIWHGTKMNAHLRRISAFFHLAENKTSFRNEFFGGLTTFMAMAYVGFVVPGMLADAGMPKEPAITALICVTAAVTLGMGLWANFPVAAAPGLGISAFFSYYVCGTLHLPWQTALGAVFISGGVFLLLTVTQLRRMIIDAVPTDLKYAIVAGIGAFIAFIGYVLLRVLAGEYRAIRPIMWAISLCFAVNFALRLH